MILETPRKALLEDIEVTQLTLFLARKNARLQEIQTVSVLDFSAQTASKRINGLGSSRGRKGMTIKLVSRRAFSVTLLPSPRER
jgi:hypothetical protein